MLCALRNQYLDWEPSTAAIMVKATVHHRNSPSECSLRISYVATDTNQSVEVDEAALCNNPLAAAPNSLLLANLQYAVSGTNLSTSHFAQAPETISLSKDRMKTNKGTLKRLDLATPPIVTRYHPHA